MLGANPYESNGSLCTAPDLPGRLEAIRARGGRIVVVDPRRTEDGGRRRRAPVHPARHRRALPVRASSTCCSPRASSTSAHSAEHVDRRRRGRAPPVAVHARSRSPTARGIDAETIRAPGARARRRRRRRRLRPDRHLHTVAVRHARVAGLVDVLNVLTGNLDRPGGAMFPHGRAHRAPTRPEGGGPRLPHSAAGPAGSRASRGRRRAAGRPSSPTRSRPPGDGPDPRADHDRRQPGAVARPTASGSPRRSPGSSSWSASTPTSTRPPATPT